MSPKARREVLVSAEEGAGDPDARIVAPVVADGGEEVEEAGLRPRSLTEFVGQAQLVEHTRSSFAQLVGSDNPMVAAVRAEGIALTPHSRSLLRRAA